jgi:antitoxin (DNA-binding transcriptional repressor) of toxin-antitoxin stability system
VPELITQTELSDDVLRRVESGESFIVTRRGVPVGELAPLRRHRFVSADAALAVFRNAPSIDAARFRADVDANADQSIEPVA